MSSWLSKRTGIHINLRPLARPLGAIAGSMLLPGVGTALGAGLGAAAAGAADNLGHGGNLRTSLKDAAISGGTAYGGAKLLPMLADKLGYGSGTAPGGVGATPTAGAAGGFGPVDEVVDGVTNYGGYGGASASMPAPSGNLAMRALKSVGGFVKKNPIAAVQAGGTAASTYASASGANADRAMYREQLQRQNAIEEEERRRRQGIGTAWVQAMAKAGNPMALELARQLGYAA